MSSIPELQAKLETLSSKRASYKAASELAGTPAASPALYQSSSGRPYVFAGPSLFIARVDPQASIASELGAVTADIRAVCKQIDQQLK